MGLPLEPVTPTPTLTLTLTLTRWGYHWNLSRPVLIEKTPTNIVTSRLLQVRPIVSIAVCCRRCSLYSPWPYLLWPCPLWPYLPTMAIPTHYGHTYLLWPYLPTMAILQALLAPSASFVFISRHPLAVSLAHLRFGVRDQSVAELDLHWLVSSGK